MPTLDLPVDTLSATEIPQLTVRNNRLSLGHLLAPLNHAMASWHRRPQQDGNQVIIRFKNGYGAVISEYRLLDDMYEIAPLRFHGPGSDDHEFHFRSHVPDLTWCSDHHEMLQVCEQISRLLPGARF
jgi:hypothetical protein